MSKQMSYWLATYLSSVYKVRLEAFTDGVSTDIYNMRILEVIKEGWYLCVLKFNNLLSLAE